MVSPVYLNLGQVAGTNETADQTRTTYDGCRVLALSKILVNWSKWNFASVDRQTHPGRRCNFSVVGPFRQIRLSNPIRRQSNRHHVCAIEIAELTSVDTLRRIKDQEMEDDEAVHDTDMVTTKENVKIYHINRSIFFLPAAVQITSFSYDAGASCDVFDSFPARTCHKPTDQASRSYLCPRMSLIRQCKHLICRAESCRNSRLVTDCDESSFASPAYCRDSTEN